MEAVASIKDTGDVRIGEAHAKWQSKWVGKGWVRDIVVVEALRDARALGIEESHAKPQSRKKITRKFDRILRIARVD
jgi:hypothetical protein